MPDRAPRSLRPVGRVPGTSLGFGIFHTVRALVRLAGRVSSGGIGELTGGHRARRRPVFPGTDRPAEPGELPSETAGPLAPRSGFVALGHRAPSGDQLQARTARVSD